MPLLLLVERIAPAHLRSVPLDGEEGAGAGLSLLKVASALLESRHQVVVPVLQLVLVSVEARARRRLQVLLQEDLGPVRLKPLLFKAEEEDEERGQAKAPHDAEEHEVLAAER